MKPTKRTAWNSTLSVSDKPLKKTPVKRVNRARMKKRTEAAYGGGKAAFVRSLPCVACKVLGVKQTTRTEAAHARSRAAGGKAAALINLCTLHHCMQHTIGTRTFENRTGLDLMFIAARVEMDWQNSGFNP